MRFSFNIRDKQYTFNTWDTKKEKELLLTNFGDAGLNEEEKANMAFHILLDDEDKYINELHYIDKIYILISMRTKCVDDIIQFSYKCEHCGNYVESISEPQILEGLDYYQGTNKVFTYKGYTFNSNINGDITSYVYKKKEYEVTPEILNQFDLDFIVKIKKETANNKPSILFKYEGICSIHGCNKNSEVVISNSNILSFLSATNITNLYNTYIDLKDKANFSLFEIDSMSPVERDIYIELINKRRKENKNNKL